MHHAQVTVIADSISPEGHRLTTFQLRYWRGIHSELMTHRAFSRNAGSSRARPSKAIIEQVREKPWGPIHWGLNQPGMQASQEAKGILLEKAKLQWRAAAINAADHAESYEKAGIHKQIVNRLLEPFTYIDVVVTATDYANWFALRDHPDAQPEIQDLARRMKAAMDASTPKLLKPGEWHLPYITDEDWEAAERYLRAIGIKPTRVEKLKIVIKVSVARCARVSYKAFDGSVSPIEKDIELHDNLLVSQPVHASPAEHQATPISPLTFHIKPGIPSMDDPYGEKERAYIFSGEPECWSNLRGWLQYRKTLPNEYVPG